MEAFLGQIMLFGPNWAPRGWALCHGQLLQINQYNALFSLLGTWYGGDGRTTFGLPDLRGRVPVGWGTGPGLNDRKIGSMAGTENNTLTIGNMPTHGHDLSTGSILIPISTSEADQREGSGHFLANGTFYHNSAEGVYGNGAIGVRGTSGQIGSYQPVNNMPPYQAVSYIICVEGGLYPSRN